MQSLILKEVYLPVPVGRLCKMRHLICIGLALTLIHCSPPPCDPPKEPPLGSKPAAGPLSGRGGSSSR